MNEHTFEDFVLPLLLQHSSDFDVRKTKRKVEHLMNVLGAQAFWLSIQEFFEDHPHVHSLQMLPSSGRRSHIDDLMTPIYHPGTSVALAEKTTLKAKRYFQKARGKFAHWHYSDWYRYLTPMLNQQHVLEPSMLPAAFEKALGPSLYQWRVSMLEQKHLDQCVPPALLAALGAKSAPRSL